MDILSNWMNIPDVKRGKKRRNMHTITRRMLKCGEKALHAYSFQLCWSFHLFQLFFMRSSILSSFVHSSQWILNIFLHSLSHKFIHSRNLIFFVFDLFYFYTNTAPRRHLYTVTHFTVLPVSTTIKVSEHEHSQREENENFYPERVYRM